jgi:hypothetical protein
MTKETIESQPVVLHKQLILESLRETSNEV